MAPRLKQGQTTDANVVHLSPRKAKGAGGQKRKGPSTNRMKPKAHEEKPKRQTAAQKAAEAAFKANPPPAVADNVPGTPAPAPAPAAKKITAQPTDADIRRDLQDKLVALHGRHRAIDNRLAVAEAAASEIRGEKKELRAAIQNAGFPLATYDEAYKKLALKTKRTDLESQEKMRALIFEALGLPVGPQPELNLTGLPEAAKPAVYWEETGYKAAIGNEFSDVERDGVPPENVQDYMQGYARGTAVNARGIGKLETGPTEPATELQLPPASIPGAELREGVKEQLEGNSAPELSPSNGQPDWSDFSTDPADWSNEQTALFRSWYDGLDPTEDVDIQHDGVTAAFDALVEAEERASRPASSELH